MHADTTSFAGDLFLYANCAPLITPELGSVIPDCGMYVIILLNAVKHNISP